MEWAMTKWRGKAPVHSVELGARSVGTCISGVVIN